MSIHKSNFFHNVCENNSDSYQEKSTEDNRKGVLYYKL